MLGVKALPTRPLTMTARLVAVVVILVAVTATVIGTATTLAMRSNLDHRLDRDVRATMERLQEGPGAGPGLPGPTGDALLNQPFGTLRALVPDDGEPSGVVFSSSDGPGWSAATALAGDQLAVLSDLGPDDTLRTVDLPGAGSYRVAVSKVPGGQIVVGLPRADVDDTIDDLVRLELLATLVGLALAAAVATLVVRRQLGPLREVAATAHRVAELPLATGEIEISERVPERLTDERTEVGQVGSALNAMLDHVEESLETRHRSEQQVRQFVADASHELRTPLATIAGYTELARRQPETTATALDKVVAESGRMTSLVEDLLLLARIDAGRPLAQEPVDLSLLLLEAVNDARVVDAGHAWQVVLPDQPMTVTGDAARLHQVVTNLLANARRHTPAGTTVTVTGTAGGFSVHDDGPGFPPELQPHAFERFSRGDAARNREGGAGLGLALVDAIVGAHGGSVSLVSAPGDTTVSVHLVGASVGQNDQRR